MPHTGRNRFSFVFARAASASAILLGLTEAAGRQLHMETLSSVYPALAATTPNSALALLLIGISLRIATTPASSAERDRLKKIVASGFLMVVLVISCVTVAEYALGRDFGIDNLIFPHSSSNAAALTRMPPTSAFAFLITGFALLLINLETGITVAQLLGMAGSFIGNLAVTGYVFAVPALYTIGKYTPMSAEVGVMLTVVGFAVLCARPDKGLMAILASPNVGGLVARRLLPLGVGFPFLLLLLAKIAQWVQLGKTAFAGEIFMLATIVLFTGPILWTSTLLYRTDKKRERAERSLAAQYAVARILAESAPVRETAPQVVKAICEHLGWSMGAVWEPNASGDGFVCPAVWPAADPAGFDRSKGTWVPGECVWTPDISRKATERPMEGVAPLGMHGAVTIPVRVEGELVAVVECFSRDIRPQDFEEIKVLEAISEQVARFVQRRRAEHEILRLNRDLQDRAAQLQAANSELEGFSYSVSHDLRAPLRHIAGFIQLLNRRTGSNLDEQSNRYLSVITKACGEMGRLIDDLLAFSRMGRTEMLKSSIDLNNLVRQVIDEWTASTGERRIEWKIGSLPEIEGDPAMIRIVLVNYISNALKYTQNREMTQIEIGALETADTELVVYVRDNGTGFDMRYAGKLFGVFQRLHRADEFEGTGIGLATVRRIVHRHGGKTWADGEVDRGATFYFSLPLNTKNSVENSTETMQETKPDIR